jgi:excisionase family DNA binding protein
MTFAAIDRPALPDPAQWPTLRVQDVARILGVGERAIYEAVARKEIPHRRIGHSIRFPTAEFRRWLGADASDVDSL